MRVSKEDLLISALVEVSNRRKSALYDVVVAHPCTILIGWNAECGKPAVGVVKVAEVGWERACSQHMDDDDEDGCIRLLPKRSAN